MVVLRAEAPPPGEVGKLLDAETDALAKRIRGAVTKVTRSVVMKLRADVKRAFPKSRSLPTTWRSTIYPENEASRTLTPAGYIFSKAPKIVAAFSDGATIRPVNGARYLWIPLPDAYAGAGKARTPAQIERRFGKFSFARDGDGAVALVEQTRGGQKLTRARRKAKEARKRVAMFALVRQVRMGKRLSTRQIAQAARATFLADVQRAVRAGG